MTKLEIIYGIYVLAGILAVSLAQPPGGFLDSTKDVVIRANTSIEIPINVKQPITAFPPYNTVIYQLSNCCLSFSNNKIEINSAFGLDKLLMAGMQFQPSGKTALILSSYNKKTGEILDHSGFFVPQGIPLEYYFSATDPYRVYMLNYDGVLVRHDFLLSDSKPDLTFIFFSGQ
jgi:hypothetical protein